MTKQFLVALTLGAVALTAAAQTLRPSTQLSTLNAAGSVRVTDNTQRPADYIVAIVNSEPITNNEVRNRTLRTEQQLSQRGAVLPPREDLARQILDRLISERAQLQVARDNGIKVDEPTIDAAVENVARQNQLTVAALRQRLSADGIPYLQFRNDLRNEILLTRVREREVESRVRVNDQEVDQYIRERQDNPDLSAVEINLAQILVAVPESASPAQVAALQAKGLRALEKAKAGADFSALVREYSDAPDAATNGGQLGLRNADRYPPLFVDAVQQLGSGAISGLLRSDAGFHILKVIEKRQAGLPGAVVTQTRARHILLRVTPQLTENAARERLTDIRRRVVAGQADFAAVARETSQDGSAKEGGDLGWANPGMFVPEFEETMNTLAPGQISEPLVSRFGVHLIQVLERRDNTLSQNEQRDIARGLVREKKQEEAFQTWTQEVRARAYVEFREPPQ
jgi:peptidyl-prolyl cis-trans isomerase SurA